LTNFVETIIDDLGSEFFPGGVISNTDNEHRFRILKILFEAGKEAKKLSAALKDTMFKNPYFHSLTKREATRIVREKVDPDRNGVPPGTQIELLIPCPDNEPDQFTCYRIFTSPSSEEPFIIILRDKTFFFDLFFRYLSEEDFISYVLLSDPLVSYESIGRFQAPEERLKVIEAFRLDLGKLILETKEKLKPFLKHTS
jgi:hypothetical protein